MLLAIGGVLGALLVVGAIAVLGLTAEEPGPAAGPNTVALMADDKLGAAVPVSRGPAALAVAGGAVWVGSEAGTVTRIDTDDFATQVAGGVGIPSTIAAGDGGVWVGEAYGGRISRVDIETVQVRDSIAAHSRRLTVADDGTVWATDDLRDRVVRLSPATLSEDGAVALEPGAGPRAIAHAGESIWVANERSGTVIEIDAASASMVGHPIGLGSSPTDIAVGGGAVWVTSLDSDRLYRIDTEQGVVAATIETCDGPDAVVASDDGVWVACRVGRVVRRLTADGSFVADVDVPGVPAALAIDGDRVWVALRGD
jgi:DNA-binding beta-propeller fold protein YncE